MSTVALRQTDRNINPASTWTAADFRRANAFGLNAPAGQKPTHFEIRETIRGEREDVAVRVERDRFGRVRATVLIDAETNATTVETFGTVEDAREWADAMVAAPEVEEQADTGIKYDNITLDSDPETGGYWDLSSLDLDATADRVIEVLESAATFPKPTAHTASIGGAGSLKVRYWRLRSGPSPFGSPDFDTVEVMGGMPTAEDAAWQAGYELGNSGVDEDAQPSRGWALSVRLAWWDGFDKGAEMLRDERLEQAARWDALREEHELIEANREMWQPSMMIGH